MSKKLTEEDFIRKSKEIHGENRYLYHCTKFVDIQTKVKIFCKAHNKEFEILPKKHLYIKQGCQLCAHVQRNRSKTKDINHFIKKAREHHEEHLYDYTNSVYTKAKNPINIFCNTCKESFNQIAAAHMDGQGCPKCSHDRGMNKQRHNTESFILAAKKVHGDLYSYHKTKYGKNNIENVMVTCNLCDTDVLIRPSNFLIGGKTTCNCVRHHGFQDHKPGIVYYLSINNGEAYKIGITNKTVEKRFHNYDLEKITVLKTWYFHSGYDARAFETKILRDYKDFKYKGPDLLGNGNSELFSTNILSL